MKTLLLVVFLGVATMATAQNLKPAATAINNGYASTVTEPEFTGQVFALGSDAQFVALESQRPQHQLSRRAFGAAGGSLAYTFRGTSSTTKLVASPEFVVRLESSGDPATLVNVDRLEVDQRAGVRKAVTFSRKGFLGKKAGAVADTAVALCFTKHGGSIKFSPTSPLAKGEYVVTTLGGRTAFLFSVE